MEKTLLVDGDNLFKIGYHGVKEYYHNRNHIGGLFHFINTLRKHLEENNFDKVLVFWDGHNNSSVRRKIYPNYKLNRREPLNEFQKDSYDWQKNKVKKYLEEMFVRQVEFEECEADDLVAYYCLIAPNEKKTIFSSDRDYLQLVDENTTVFAPISKIYYKNGDKVKIYEYEIPVSNILTYKILTGDKSDNIAGIYGLGEKKLIKYFPELLDETLNITNILHRAELLIKEDKDNKTLQNLLTGRTKEGIFGEEYFQVNEQIVNLKNPLLTDEAKEMVQSYCTESLDPDGRGYKNLIRMMTDDGIFKYLPKRDDAWVGFITPFLKLTRKEKRKHTQNKNK